VENGSVAAPYRSIGAAVAQARPGDTILVGPGIYREKISPPRGGEPGLPIILRSEVPYAAIVRGSEVLMATPLSPGNHQIPIPPDLVGTQNPFAMRLDGSRIGGCLGQVFVGDRELREVGQLATVEDCPGTWTALAHGTLLALHIPSSWTPGTLEISVRDRLWAPAQRGTGYLRVEGFVFERCANPSAAAFWESNRRQCGAIGFRAGHHIEFVANIIRDIKTIGLDMGIEGGLEAIDDIIPYDNLVEGNEIRDCGEVGACGRRSRRTIVRGNLIERNSRLSLHTVEEAGLKFHEFEDGRIEANVVRDNESYGIWLDAMWTGARISRNWVVNNLGAGIFVELGADQATVDHNIVAMTRLGDGIYTHDASDVLIAHNLLFGNAHFGVYQRYVTDRAFPHADGVTRPAECSRNRVLNNLFIDNYRGPLCLPGLGPRSQANVSHGNHFLNGTQWQWEGLGFHRFCLGDNDGSIPAESLLEQVVAAGADKNQWRANAYLNLDQWHNLGYDRDSHAPGAFRITHENGAVVKGTATVGSRDQFVQLRLSPEAVAPPVETLAECPADFFGRPRSVRSSPGPVAELPAGHHALDFTPR